MRYNVAKVIKQTLRSLSLQYPTLTEEERDELSRTRKQLLAK